MGNGGGRDLPKTHPLPLPRLLRFWDGEGRRTYVLPSVGCQSPVVQPWMAGCRVPEGGLSPIRSFPERVSVPEAIPGTGIR